ncbi:MAG: histidine kinase [Bacteroidales bacterium]|nr:histidine kinase [Bacteroidales bacterium]MCF8458303.1 histidine kinase [Bacteroidales bacterium]
MGDSLSLIQRHSEAFDFYQNELNSPQSISDTFYRAEIYHRLCMVSEALNLFREAIDFHLKWRNLQPFTNQQENQRYLDKVADLLPKATDSLGLTRLYYRYGLLLTREANRDQALQYFLRALNFANGIKNYAAVATIANDLAGEYWDAGQRDLSTKMYRQSLEAAIAINDSNRMAGAYLNIAGNYIDEGDFKTGIQIHLKALKIKESLEDKSNLSYYYQQTAEVYYHARNFEKWEEYILKAYQIKDCEDCTSPMEKATLYGELGGIAKHKNQLQPAIQYFDTLLIISTEIAYQNGQKTALDNLALINKDLGNYKKALELTNKSEAFLTDNPFYHISHNNTKVELLQRLGKHKDVLALLTQNIENKALPNYASEKLRTFRLLYETNLQLAKYQDAFSWNDSLRVLENRLRDVDVRKEMAALETKYQTEKKEQQIYLLTAENEINNQRIKLSWLFIAFLFVLLVMGLILLFFRRKQAAFKQSELQQQLLRSQMNPHFIYNVMGSIQGYLYNHEAVKAADYLSKFASLSRSVLEFSAQESISLSKEIEMLQNYIELERARMSSPFEVEYNIDSGMETDFIEIPPMLLQPFVENAIKHGLQNLNYSGKLSFCFREIQGYVAVEIVDNGKGLPVSKDKDHNSKALEIFHQRKKGIERKFKKEITFEFQNLNTIDNTKKGVRVFLHLPILNHD